MTMTPSSNCSRLFVAALSAVLILTLGQFAFAQTGACCETDGACTDSETQLNCEGRDGIYQGDSTSCALETGACCLPDGTCTDGATQVCCEAAGGTYQGDSTSCSVETGACCLPDGSCTSDTTRECCEAAQGTFLEGDTCTALEACCLPDGSCEDLDPLCCVERGGLPQGTGTDCETACVPIPAVSDLGMFLLIVLMLVAAMVVINRRRATVTA